MSLVNGAGGALYPPWGALLVTGALLALAWVTRDDQSALAGAIVASVASYWLPVRKAEAPGQPQ